MSELLGSFGDNELSPECLDGAQRFLKGQPYFEFKIHFFPLNDADAMHQSKVELNFGAFFVPFPVLANSP